MPKSSKPKNKKEASINADINIDGNVTNSNIIIGHGNTINVEATITTYGLFTIPQPVIDFTGREGELAQLKEAFENGAIITGVSGGGGIGKTELARKLAHDIEENYPDAHMNIDLQGTSVKPISSEDAMRRLLEPFYAGQKLPDDKTQLKGLYHQTFSNKKVLLLLDNAANAGQVRPLIPPRPSAAIITSRQHFSLTEFGFHEPLRLNVLSPEGARELLRNASPKLNDSPAKEVGKLAKLCGNLPLALRIAASLLNDRPDWTLSTLLSQLTDERTRLQKLKRENDPDFDVEAMISLSYNLLPNDEIKKRFLMLGVFSNFCWFQAIASVWQLENYDSVEQSIGILLNRSLLNSQVISATRLGSGEIVGVDCYTMHDLTRLFVLDRLHRDDAISKIIAERHATYFLGLATIANQARLQGVENSLQYFRSIWPDLYSAWDRMRPNQQNWPRPDIADHWLEGFYTNCSNFFEDAVSANVRIVIIETALEMMETSTLNVSEEKEDNNLESPEDVLYIPMEAVLLMHLADALVLAGESRKAIRALERALAILNSLDGKFGDHTFVTGRTLGHLGTAHFWLGEIDKATEYFEKSLVIARETHDKKSESTALGNIANVYNKSGNDSEAIIYYKKQLLLTQKEGYLDEESDALGNMGTVFSDIGESKKAMKLYKQALVIAQKMDDWLRIGNRLGNIGYCHNQLGNPNEAISALEQALVYLRAVGDRRTEGEILINLGIAYRRLGENDKVLKLLQEGLEIFQATEDPRVNQVEEQIAQTWWSLGIEGFVHAAIEAHLTKSTQAANFFEEVSKMATDSDMSHELQELGKVLQKILAGVKNPDLSNLSEALARLVKTELEK